MWRRKWFAVALTIVATGEVLVGLTRLAVALVAGHPMDRVTVVAATAEITLGVLLGLLAAIGWRHGRRMS